MSLTELWAARAAEDFNAEGWLYVPPAMAGAQRREWIAEALEYLRPLVGVKRWDGSVTTAAHLRDLLELAVDDTGAVEALATFQVWPIPGPAALTCNVRVVSGEVVGGVLGGASAGAIHPIDAANIGPGIQFSTRTQVETEEGSVDFYSVDLIFDDGADAVVISLEQSIAALISN